MLDEERNCTPNVLGRERRATGTTTERNILSTATL